MEQTGQDVSQTLRVIIILYVMLLRYFLYLFFCLTVSVPLCVCVDIDRPSSFFPNSLYFYSYMTTNDFPIWAKMYDDLRSQHHLNSE
jgi:hypothetical protein